MLLLTWLSAPPEPPLSALQSLIGGGRQITVEARPPESPTTPSGCHQGIPTLIYPLLPTRAHLVLRIFSAPLLPTSGGVRKRKGCSNSRMLLLRLLTPTWRSARPRFDERRAARVAKTTQ